MIFYYIPVENLNIVNIDLYMFISFLWLRVTGMANVYALPFSSKKTNLKREENIHKTALT